MEATRKRRRDERNSNISSPKARVKRRSRGRNNFLKNNLAIALWKNPFVFDTDRSTDGLFEKSKRKSNLTSVTEQQRPRQGGITLHYIFVMTTV